MNPLILARLGSLGPALGRLFSRSPGLMARVVESMRKGSAFVGSSVADIVAFARSNPTAAAFTLATLAQLGIAVNELFGDDPEFSKLSTAKGMDSESMEFLRGLYDVSSAVSPAQRAEAGRMLIANAAKSEGMQAGLAANETMLYATANVLKWAIGVFGSRSAALEAHVMMQAFVELPHEDVRTGYDMLRLA